MTNAIKPNISVLIPTKNEELNIGRCLKAIEDWADEIIVIDSQSTDRTIDIATSCGAKVIQFVYQGGVAQKKTMGLRQY